MTAAAEMKPARKPSVTQVWHDIFASAQKLFAERGYAGVSISDIATDAGIAKSTVLHHFPSKLKLYQRVVKQSLDQFMEVTGQPAPGNDSADQVVQSLRRLLRWMVAEPVHAKLLNRIFMDNPQGIGIAAKKYWLPLLTRLSAIFPHDFPIAPDQLRLSIIFVVNSIFQLAFSIELQVLLFAGKMDAEKLCQEYEKIIDTIILHRLNGVTPVA